MRNHRWAMALLVLGALARPAWAHPPARPAEAGSAVRSHALRLGPGADLREGILAFAKARGLRAAAVATCVGSLTRARLRFANRSTPTDLEGPFEIVSLVGTLGDGGSHLHAGLADADGRVVGGHLGPGAIVFTTAEIVLVESQDLVFDRAPDPASGFRELVVRERRLAP